MTEDDEGYQHEIQADGHGEAKADAEAEAHDGIRREKILRCQEKDSVG